MSFGEPVPINPGYGNESFSRTELLHITVAVLVLSASFANVFRRGLSGLFNEDPFLDYLGLFGMSLILILTCFLMHELGHKFMAQRYGAWAEFRMFPTGLAIAFLLSFTGFLFAAPGAVYIEGRITRKEYGLISLAGPVANLAMAAVGIALIFVATGPILYLLVLFIVLNTVLALFNLIPLPPLDGSKILRWNPAVYAATVTLAAAMYIFVRF